MARIGVVGAGRVGAVLSAALRAAGHEVVAAAGDSSASLQRIETMLPGVRARQADRRRASMRPAAAHRPRRHAQQRRDHPRRCRRHPGGPGRLSHLGPPRPRRARAGDQHRRSPDRDAPRDDLHRHRARPRPPRRLRVRHDRRPRRAGVRRGPRLRPRRHCALGAGEQAHALPRRPRPRRQPPRHPGQPGDGASGRFRCRGPRCHAPATVERRPRQRARVWRRRAHGANRARRRADRAGPPGRHRTECPGHDSVVRRDGEGHRRPGRPRRTTAADPRCQARAHARRSAGARRGEPAQTAVRATDRRSESR